GTWRLVGGRGAAAATPPADIAGGLLVAAYRAAALGRPGGAAGRVRRQRLGRPGRAQPPHPQSAPGHLQERAPDRGQAERARRAYTRRRRQPDLLVRPGV